MRRIARQRAGQSPRYTHYIVFERRGRRGARRAVHQAAVKERVDRAETWDPTDTSSWGEVGTAQQLGMLRRARSLSPTSNNPWRLG
jgi:hypothetical protein